MPDLRTRVHYVFRGKWFRGGWAARLRAFWHIVLRGYWYEVCGHCGRPVGLVWWCDDDDLWRRVNGGEGGIMCVRCFDAGADGAGQTVRWVAYHLEPL